MRMPVCATPRRCTGKIFHRGAAERCTKKAVVWLHNEQGEAVPDGAFCRACADALIAEYRVEIGAEWSARPILRPCSHGCDPRECATCRGRAVAS